MNTQFKAHTARSLFNSSSCRILLATCLRALCLIALSSHAATIIVTNTNDSGAGSLRQAIADAHDGDTVNSGISGAIILTSGELLLDKSITIRGSGSNNLTVDGNVAGRVLYVSSGVTALISGLTIANGNVQGDEVTSGGGIYNDHATVALEKCTVRDNYAGWGGGGIYNNSGTLILTDSTISGNWAAAPLSVGDGGGIYNEAGTLTVSNCTISGNGGAAFTRRGGAIYNSGMVTITNSTFSGNSADVGGGLYNFGTVTIGNTIFKTGISGDNFLNYATITSVGYNLSNDSGAGLLTGIGDQISTDPVLGPLRDNGGPTFTHALLTGSPAIDAGKNLTSQTTDQRGTGFARTFDSTSISNANGSDGTDIGAFEVQRVTPTYAGQVQPPINADGTSVFSAGRGVVPVKFNLTEDGVATCNLPPATIAVTRTGGGVTGAVNESLYNNNADTGSSFRIDNCQYLYNLNSRALGIGIYRIDILINDQVTGSAIIELR